MDIHTFICCPPLVCVFHWLIFLSDTVEDVFLIQRSRTNHAYTAIQFSALSWQPTTCHVRIVYRLELCLCVIEVCHLYYSHRKRPLFFLRKARGPSTLVALCIPLPYTPHQGPCFSWDWLIRKQLQCPRNKSSLSGGVADLLDNTKMLMTMNKMWYEWIYGKHASFDFPVWPNMSSEDYWICRCDGKLSMKVFEMITLNKVMIGQWDW